MTPSPSPDLFDRVRAGDTKALSDLLEELRPLLVVLAQRDLGTALRKRVDPGDMVQETCLAAHRDLKDFRGTSREEFVGWLKRILHNTIAGAGRQHLQSEKRNLGRERSLDDSTDSVAGLKSFLASEVSSPSQRVMRGEDSIRLAGLLLRLPEDQREAVRLRHLEGWSLNRIAESMNRSELAAASLLKRGLIRLRIELRDPDESRA